MRSIDRIILALDRPNLESGCKLLDSMPCDLRWVKVGLELFTAEGPPAVTTMQERGKRVFLDLKLHDIPNTVAGAVRSAAKLGVDLLTLHIAGGVSMLEAAARARDEANPNMKLLGITVLTSLDGSEFPELYTPLSVPERVLVLARSAQEAGLDGVVCSPRELEPLRGALGEGFLKVTPGIRLPGGATQDQKRTASPGAAVSAGAAYLVVGRALTRAPDPYAAWEALLADCSNEGRP